MKDEVISFDEYKNFKKIIIIFILFHFRVNHISILYFIDDFLNVLYFNPFSRTKKKINKK